MSRNSFVPGCRKGYKSQIKTNKWQRIIKKKTMFKAPKVRSFCFNLVLTYIIYNLLFIF